MNEKRGFLYVFTGLLLGVGLGLLIAWVLAPVQFVNTSPASLRTDFKDEYRFMIAAAYGVTSDLPRAQARLTAIGDLDSVKALGEQAQRMLADQSPMQMVQVLADLSEALQSHAATVAPPLANPTSAVITTQEQIISGTSSPSQEGDTPTPAITALTTSPETESPPTPEDTSTPNPSPNATLALRPKRTATPTPGPAFELAQQASLCEPSQPGLLQIYLSDAAGKPVAGVELVITWFGGEEHFFSGLKPEINPGYADYTLSETVEYDLSFSAAGTRVTGLRAPACTDASGNAYPGGIRLEFKQP